jgi:uncharacterized protein (DUF2062 family)
MTGVKAPAGVIGASVVVSHAPHHATGGVAASVARSTLPFTGIALGTYLAIGLSLVLAGLLLRVYAARG